MRLPRCRRGMELRLLLSARQPGRRRLQRGVLWPTPRRSGSFSPGLRESASRPKGFAALGLEEQTASHIVDSGYSEDSSTGPLDAKPRTRASSVGLGQAQGYLYPLVEGMEARYEAIIHARMQAEQAGQSGCREIDLDSPPSSCLGRNFPLRTECCLSLLSPRLTHGMRRSVMRRASTGRCRCPRLRGQGQGKQDVGSPVNLGARPVTFVVFLLLTTQHGTQSRNLILVSLTPLRCVVVNQAGNEAIGDRARIKRQRSQRAARHLAKCGRRTSDPELRYWLRG